VLVAAVFIGLFLLILGGKAVVTADMPLFKIINTHHTAFFDRSKYKKLVFGGAGRGRIFTPILPSNHREEV
jgi:hypothetical protein